jgi:hypothetical protein
MDAKKSSESVVPVNTILQKTVTLIAFHLCHFVGLCCVCLVVCVLVCSLSVCCPIIFRITLNLLSDPLKCHGRFYTPYFVSLFDLVFVAQLDDALRYKPEGGGFDSRWFY